MVLNNPFTIAFGKQPPQFISRLQQTETIINSFRAEVPTTQVYMLTGVRGSGKTVLLTNIAKIMREQDDWIVIELNPESDMIHGFASKLYSIPNLQKLFVKASLDLSMFGIGLSIEKSMPVANLESGIDRMLTELDKKNKKVLIEIDEVTNSEYMRVFASAFQIFMRQDHNVFLLMTGLYENINNLQNEKSLTFLYRVPKIFLSPLNIGAIARSYKEIFDISYDDALLMSKKTRGYPFAFQVLGYLKWENKEKKLEEILPVYQQYLEEYVYDKIYSELSVAEKKILLRIAKEKDEYIKVKEIRDTLTMNSSLFSTYRDKLIKKGLIDASQYGFMSLMLPGFGRFVIEHSFEL